jgi:hypothetical protein
MLKAAPKIARNTYQNGIRTNFVESLMFKKGIYFRFFLLWMILCAAVSADAASKEDELFSPSVGQQFYEIAYEIANSQDLGIADAEQGLIFLSANRHLDIRGKHILSELVKLSMHQPDKDHSELIHASLRDTFDETGDLQVAADAISYLISQLDSREEREQLLAQLKRGVASRSDSLMSEIATLQGLLAAEIADTESASRFFLEAYNYNNYNQLAFLKVSELIPDQIEPASILVNLRTAVTINPLDLEAALAYAGYAMQLELYHTAAETYAYCAELLAHLDPSMPLPASIYVPWAQSNYNTPRNWHNCLQIAERLRQQGTFDIEVESMAAKAALRLGDNSQYNKIIEQIESRDFQNTVLPAWYYSFVVPDMDAALAWSNKAYSADPNSALAASLLAYSLAMSDQGEWASTLIESYERNQIFDLAMANIQMSEGKTDSVIETLKMGVARGPWTLEAELAKALLEQLGGEYLPSVDTTVVTSLLRNEYGRNIVPIFADPGKSIKVQLSARGDKFSYGRSFGASLAITNNSTEPLVISDQGLFTGRLRVDARISGDIELDIGTILQKRFKPTKPIAPEQSLVIPLRLYTGRLRRILLMHPQASIDIEFTAYLDPLDSSGNVTNRVRTLEPIKLQISRHGKELSTGFIQNRLNTLTRGQQGQKIEIARLFVGLLAEQQAMADSEPLYKFMYADWMPKMLKSALIENLGDDDWVAKIHTMRAMLALELDYDLLDAVSGNLDEEHWPARMMAIYILAKNQGAGFQKVLDWTAKSDQNDSVRQMAIALGGQAPEAEPEPEEVIEETYLQQQQRLFRK